MTEHTTAPAHRASEVQERATRMVGYLRREVLTVPGRRAPVRAAVGREPGDPRTFHALREVAAFLPETPDPVEERAFVAVAALICAQPPGPREQDITTGSTSTPHHGNGSAPAQDTATNGETAANQATTRVRSLGQSCAFAVNRGMAAQSPMESRLHALCRVDSVGLHRQLPRLVTQLRGGRELINWPKLVADLAAWDRARQRIAARWLRDFYRELAAQSPTSSLNNAQENP